MTSREMGSEGSGSDSASPSSSTTTPVDWFLSLLCHPSELPFWSQVSYWFQKTIFLLNSRGLSARCLFWFEHRDWPIWTEGVDFILFFANPRNPLPVAARDSTGLLRIHWRGDSWRAMRANGCAGAPSEGSAELRKPWLNALTGSWGCLKIGYPQNHRFQYEHGLIWMIWGYHHFRKFPFRVCFS